MVVHGLVVRAGRLIVLALVGLALASCVGAPRSGDSGSQETPGGAAPAEPNLAAIAQQYPVDQPFENSQFIDINRTRYHYRVFGATSDNPSGGVPKTAVPDRPGVILIHGFGASTFSYRYLAADLAAAGYTVVAVDLPGFGFTSRIPGADKSDGQRAEDLWQLLSEAVPDQDSWVVVGHSYGGRIALRMAYQSEERTAAMVGISAAILGRNRITGLFRIWPLSAILRNRLARSAQSPQFVMDSLKDAYGREPTEEEIAGYLAPTLAPNAAEGFADYVLAKRPQVVRDEEGKVLYRAAADLLERVDVPTLFVWGSDDTWVDPEDGPVLVDRMANARLVTIEGAGHVPQETHPDETAELILRFIFRHKIDF